MNFLLKRTAFIFILFLGFWEAEGFAEKVYLKRIIDSDTIVLRSKERVRFIGIDAPELFEGNKMSWNSRKWKMDVLEIKELGVASRDFLIFLFESAGSPKEVLLKYDRNNVFKGHRDKYGRKLAYIYIPFSGNTDDHLTYVFETINNKQYLSVNATLIRSGYVFARSYSRFDKIDDFLAYEKEARENKRGLWNMKKGFFYIWKYIKGSRKK